ncbi:conserved hypothetical protein [Coccidioides posadasii str. Silveira]|uniref:DUF7514 domain-containing protein n=1 Tax=Coccidioides posadasii (strain RMSCC 757 / Silveira) TaxID=443226 RepID=E9D902_COCPS|nr:conserved hypothetical protein [Coccidioides posadasii str. Silveira]
MLELIEYAPMASQGNPTQVQWSYLVNPDKSPTPQLEQLCLGIALFISNLTKSNTRDLMPDKLATFYQQVGGDYDDIFLRTPPASLSFIYQKLGCFHSLQPTCDAFEAPTIPALLPHGFVRWQTIQLLLCPEEHAFFLQGALKKFNIINPATGEVFPKEIPRSVFPSGPDPEIVQWHESVTQRLEQDFWASKTGIFPRRSSTDNRPNPKGPPGCTTRDCFSSEHPTSRSEQNVPAGMAPHPNFPYPRSSTRVMPNDPSPRSKSPDENARRRGQSGNESSTAVRESRSSQSFRHGRPSPPQEGRRGRSCTPSDLRWSQVMSDSLDSSESESESVPPFREPYQHGPYPTGASDQRRHPHDAGISRQRRWSKSPRRAPDYDPRQEMQSDDFPMDRHSRRYHYAHAYPSDDEDEDEDDAEEELRHNIQKEFIPVSARRYSHQLNQERYTEEPRPQYDYTYRTTSAPTRRALYPTPPNPSTKPIRPRSKEYHVIHPDFTKPDPPTIPAAGFVGAPRHQSYSRTPPTPGGVTYTRYYVPRVESESYHAPSRSRHSSRPRNSGRSRSRGPVERPFSLSGGLTYQSAPGPGKRCLLLFLQTQFMT